MIRSLTSTLAFLVLALFSQLSFVAAKEGGHQNSLRQPADIIGNKPPIVRDGDMTIRIAGSGGNCADCTWIQIEGAIPNNAGETFERFVERNVPADKVGWRVYLNSNGGNLDGAFKLGRAIRKRGYSTAVGKSAPDDPKESSFEDINPGRCLSACAYAFLGGVTRSAAVGEIGIHRFYDPKALGSGTTPVFTAQEMAQEQEELSEALAYISEMGVSANFLMVAGQTPSEQVHYLSKEELSAWAASLDAETVQGWKMEEDSGGLVLSARSSDNKHGVIFYCSRKLGSFISVRYYDLDTTGITTLHDIFYSYVSDGKGPEFTLYPDSGTEFKLYSTPSSFSSVGNQVSIELSLPQQDVARLGNTQQMLELFIATSHAEQGWFTLKVAMEQAFSKNAGIVQKNCIK